MDDDAKRIGEALDPSQYAVHVTRTALLLEQLARDMKALREQTEASLRGTDALRASVGEYERDFAVFKANQESKVTANQDAIKNMEERLRWLSRLVIGALITAIIGGVIALVFKLVVR